MGSNRTPVTSRVPNKRLKLTSCRAQRAAGFTVDVAFGTRMAVPVTRTQLNRDVRRLKP